MSSAFTIQLGDCQLQLIKGDITQVPADVVVNAANSRLAGGGGVDGAIHRAAGPSLMRELGQYDGCATGSAVVTSAGNLPARFVFHAVGPVFRDGRQGEPQLLAACYSTCLDLAVSHGARSISFPSISTGVYGYPAKDAAQIAVETIEKWLAARKSRLTTIKLVQFSEHDHAIYLQTAEKLLAGWRSSDPATAAF